MQLEFPASQVKPPGLWAWEEEARPARAVTAVTERLRFISAWTQAHPTFSNTSWLHCFCLPHLLTQIIVITSWSWPSFGIWCSHYTWGSLKSLLPSVWCQLFSSSRCWENVFVFFHTEGPACSCQILRLPLSQESKGAVNPETRISASDAAV